MYQRKGNYSMKSTLNIQTIFDEQGNKIGVMMSVKQFKRLMSDREDLQDLYVAYQRTQKKEKTIPLEQVMKNFAVNIKKLKEKSLSKSKK